MKTNVPLLGVLLALCLHLHSQQLDWAHHIGSMSTDFGYAIAADNSGNVYSTGFFGQTSDFDPGPNTHNLSATGQTAYVWKLDSSGALVWAKALDASEGSTIAVDPAGSVYISGEFQGTRDMDPGPGVFNISSTGIDRDLFFLKLDAAGNFQWATAITGAWSEWCNAIAADSLGNLFITGHFRDTATFSMASSQTSIIAPTGVSNAFIAKINTSGQFEWVKQLGSNSSAIGKGIDLGKDGFLYVGGNFKDSAYFTPPMGTSTLTSSGSYDVYLCKLSPTGNLIWQKSLGASGEEKLEALSVSDSGYIYTAGGFKGTTDMAPGPPVLNLTAAGSFDIFVAKMDTAANTLWARNMGGASSSSSAFDISIDAFGNVYTTGTYNGGTIDADPGPATHTLNWAGHGDIFISKLNAAGHFDWAAGIGNSFLDIGFGITTDAAGNCYSTGHFSGSVDFDPDTSSYSLTSASLWDNYVVKYSPCLIDTQQVITACDSFSPPSSTLSFTQSGQYTQYISIAGACDSLVQYNFSILNSDSVFMNPTSCDSLVSPSGRYTWFSNGLYTDTLSGQGGCDSILWIDLTVADTSSSFLNVMACDTYLSPGGKNWSNSGLYVDTIPNNQGCDSIMNIQLAIKNSTSALMSDTACNSYTSPSGQHFWTNSGTYTDTLVNQVGCDSLLSINLHIRSPIKTLNPRACLSYTSPTGAKTWTSSGTYFDTIQRPGCDSILKLNLVIDSVDVSITINSPSLTATANADSYQWIYCDSLPLVGDTAQNFTAMANGRYAVILSINGCTDTSECITVSNVRLEDNLFFRNLSVYPSPTSGRLHLNMGAIYDYIQVSQYDLQGRLMERERFEQGQHLNFDMKGTNGIYLLKVDSEGKSTYLKVVKSSK